MADANSRLFRKTALDRLSSPEQLDVMVRITSPVGWVALLTILSLLLIALAWGIFGNIPTKVMGSAILIKSGGVVEVAARSQGLITDVSVKVGDMVSRGQRIARIAQPALLEEFNQLRDQREELINKSQSSGRLLTQKRASVNFTIDVLKRRIDEQNALLREGLITRQTLLGSQQQLEEAAAQLKQFDLQKVEQDIQMADVDRRIESVRTRLKFSTDVFSPYSGRILEVKLDENSTVQAGSAILNMELTGDSIKDLEVVAFVSAGDGKKVKPGMELYVAPSTVKREEYGYMIARVTSVSEFPSTQQGMMRILQNLQLVQQLSANSSPIQITADLIPDPKATSGYRWTSPGGPPLTVQSGTIGAASVTVRSQRPISLVVPLLREFVGI